MDMAGKSRIKRWQRAKSQVKVVAKRKWTKTRLKMQNTLRHPSESGTRFHFSFFYKILLTIRHIIIARKKVNTSDYARSLCNLGKNAPTRAECLIGNCNFAIFARSPYIISLHLVTSCVHEFGKTHLIKKIWSRMHRLQIHVFESTGYNSYNKPSLNITTMT